MYSSYKIAHYRFVFIFLIFILFIFPTGALAKTTFNLETVEVQKLELVSGKSIVLRSRIPIKRLSIADPEVADVVLLSANEIYLKG